MLKKRVSTFCTNFIVTVNNYFELGVCSCMFRAELYTFHLHDKFIIDLLYISMFHFLQTGYLISLLLLK